jgi:poly-gamma-glutamate synthesis protein (capsule biosynthesis protein)
MQSIGRLAFILSFLFLLSGCTAFQPALEPLEEETPPKIERATIAVVGDIMCHKGQLSTAYQSEKGSYDFTLLFREVEPYLKSTDLTIGNLETTLAGKGLGYSGYPRFNSPDELARDLKAVGFDVLTTANNHCLDKGEKGLLRTLEVLDANGLYHTGTFASKEERKPLLIEINGIRIAILAYTYGTNGIPIPKSKDYLVNLIDLEQAQQDISKAKEEGADFIIASLHFGTEYRRTPTEEQRGIAQQFFAMGTDIIFGSHPHVLQPMEKGKRINNDGTETETFIIYSLGNFISGQRDRYTDSGVILNVEIEKDFAANKTSISCIDYIPTVVQRYSDRNRIKYRVLPVEKGIYDYEQEVDPFIRSNDYQHFKTVWKETTGLLTIPGQIEVLKITNTGTKV